MWILLFVTMIDSPEPRAIPVSVHDTLAECELAQLELEQELGGYPEGTNSICLSE